MLLRTPSIAIIALAINFCIVLSQTVSTPATKNPKTDSTTMKNEKKDASLTTPATINAKAENTTIKNEKMENLVTLETKKPNIDRTVRGEDLLYDLKTQRCCMGVVHPVEKPSYQRCCAAELIDITKHLCCRGVPNEQKLGHYCCGNTTYNTDTEVCCHGNAVTKQGKQDKCCGNQLFNSETHVCCRSKPTAHIAEKTTSGAYICCGNKAYEKNSGLLCCGSKSNKKMNDINQMKSPKCCGLVAFDASNVTLSCCDHTVVYNSHTHICCVDRNVFPHVFKISPFEKNHHCCGADSFNVKFQICCKGKVVDHPDNGKGICC